MDGREEDIAAVLSETWLKKQVRFSTMKSSDDYRECPNPACLHLVSRELLGNVLGNLMVEKQGRC